MDTIHKTKRVCVCVYVCVCVCGAYRAGVHGNGVNIAKWSRHHGG